MKKIYKTILAVFGILIFLIVATYIGYQYIPIPAVKGSNAELYTRKIAINAPIKIYFSQSMKKSSVEKTFRISPEKSGSFSWENGQTLVYTPDEKFQIDKVYYVTIGDKAESIYGKALGREYQEKFIIVGPPQVIMAIPMDKEAESITQENNSDREGAADDSVDSELDTEPETAPETREASYPVVSMNQKITVMFDRPIRPLQIKDDENTEVLEEYLHITPEVNGIYEWLGTSSFTFIPEKLSLGTVYEAKVPKGSKTLDSGETDEDFIWHFETPELRIVETSPKSGEPYFHPNGEIYLSFNQEVKLEDVQKHFQIYPSNDIKEGSFDNDGFFNGEFYHFEEDGEKDMTKIRIKPDPALKRNTGYKVVFLSGVIGNEGPKPMKDNFEFTFVTLDEAKVKSHYPPDGEKNANPYDFRITFNTPMEMESVLTSIKISPDVKLNDSYFSDAHNTEYYFDYDVDPSTEYTITIEAGLKDANGEEVQELPKTIRFTTKKMDSYFGLLTKGNKGVFDVNNQSIFYTKSVNISSFNIEYCKIDFQTFVNKDSNYDWYDYRCSSPEKWEEVLSDPPLNKYTFYPVNLSEKFGNLDQGLYFIDFYSNDYRRDWGDRKPYHYRQAFVVTDTSIVTKLHKDQALVWVNDFITGNPVSGMDVTVFDDKGKRVASGKTNKDGIYEVNQEMPRTIYAQVQHGERYSVVSSDWDNGISKWDFGLEGAWSWMTKKQTQIYAYTERPIYRPGHKVYFKGFVRDDERGKMVLPSTKTVKVTIEDSNYDEVLSEEFELSTNGTFDGNFTLGSDVPLGEYSLRVSSDNEDREGFFYRRFWVEEYRKPEYKVEIDTTKNEYVQGETIRAKVKGSYYFGGALPNADVRWNILAEPYYFSEYDGEWYNFADTDYFYRCFWYCTPEQEEVASGEGKLDDQGQYTLEHPIDIHDKDVSQLYSVTATITDINDQEVSKRVTYPIHKGDFYVGIKVNGYIFEPNEDVNFDVISVDSEGIALKNKELKVQLYKRDWNTVRKQGVDGEFYYDNEISDSFIEEKAIITGENGKGSIAFAGPDGGGLFVAKVRGQDKFGNVVLASVDFYVSSGGYVLWGKSNNDRIDLTPDKSEYEIGETAKIVVQSPFDKPVAALITYEREDIIQKEVRTLDNTNSVIEVPITEDMIPNIFVSVVLFKGSGKEGQLSKTQLEISELKEAIEDLKLNKGLKEQDKDDLEKSDEEENRKNILLGKMTREIEEYQSQIDEKQAILDELVTTRKDLKDELDNGALVHPELKLGYTTLSVNTKSKKLNVDITMDKDHYDAGDKVEMKIKVTNSENNPVKAELSLAVIDESILALKSLGQMDLVKYFYAKRGLAVETATNMIWFMERKDLKAEKGAKGGGGEGEEDEKKKRGEFRDTAYWNPKIETNENGEAEIEFSLPDNLTTWQVISLGITNDSLVGAGKTSFMTTKKLMVRPVTPRFVTVNDEVYIWGIVHNQTDTPQNVKAKIMATNVEAITGEEKEVYLEPHENKKIGWKMKVKKPVDEWKVEFTYRVENEDKSLLDIVDHVIPIKPYSVPETIALNGVTEDSTLEVLQLSDKIDPTLGSLTLTISPTLIRTLTESFDYLLQYPYGCSEQVMSRVLPAVVLKQFSDTINNKDVFTLDEDKLKEIVEMGLQKEYEYQRSDGGYGYWTGSDYSYPYLSAYILYGFTQIENAGFVVDEDVKNKLHTFVQNFLAKNIDIEEDPYRRLSLDDKAFMLWVLTESGEGNITIANTLYDRRGELSLFAKGYLAMSFHSLVEGQGGTTKELMKNKISRLKFEIESKAFIDDRIAHFEEEEQNYWSMNTNMRTTAIALMTFIRIEEDHPLIPKITQWLRENNRTQGRVQSTQDVIWYLLAMKEYLERSGELEPRYNGKVIVNKDVIVDENFIPETAFNQAEEVLDITDIVIGINEIQLKKEGEGKMYYDVESTYYLPLEELPARSEGIEIIRHYYSLDDKDLTTPLESYKLGDTIKGRLTIIVPEDRHNVLIEEYLPAAFEAINFNLDIVDQSLKLELESESERWGYTWWESDMWRFNHKEMRDDRVVLFADYLPSGVYEYDFLVRVTSAGSFHHLPAQGVEMYFPEVFGRTEGKIIEVELDIE